MVAEANIAEQNPTCMESEHVEALLEPPTNPNFDQEVHEAPPQDPEALFDCLVSHTHQAARYNDIEDVRSLAAIGVSLNSKDEEGRTALHMASANGNLDIVNYLISNNADVNVCNVENNTPLHWACLNGHIEVVKILIIAGADVSSLNRHERTPVDEAAIGGKMDVIDAINTTVAQVELTRANV